MFGLLTRLSVIFSVPVISALQNAYAGEVYKKVVNEYSDEAIIFLCLVVIPIGSIASILTPDPATEQKISVIAKLVYSILASIIAMVYIIHFEKQLSIVHVAWVAGVAFVAPSVVPSLKALIFELLPTIKDNLKKRINAFFGIENKEN